MHSSNFESRKNLFIPFFPSLRVVHRWMYNTSFSKILTVFAIETERSFWFIYACAMNIRNGGRRRLSNKILKICDTYSALVRKEFFSRVEKF